MRLGNFKRFKSIRVQILISSKVERTKMESILSRNAGHLERGRKCGWCQVRTGRLEV